MNENKKYLPDDDYTVFIPDEDMRAIERTIRNMEQVKQELQKIKENINLSDNGEYKTER